MFDWAQKIILDRVVKLPSAIQFFIAIIVVTAAAALALRKIVPKNWRELIRLRSGKHQPESGKLHIDSINKPSKSAIFIEEDEATIAIRDYNKVRRLREAEVNRKAKDLPEGVYGFATEWDVDQHINHERFDDERSIGFWEPLHLQRDKDEHHCYEIHKKLDGTLWLTGFATREDVQKCKERNPGTHIRIAPRKLEGAPSFVELRVDRIKNCEIRKVMDLSVLDLELFPETKKGALLGNNQEAPIDSRAGNAKKLLKEFIVELNSLAVLLRNGDRPLFRKKMERWKERLVRGIKDGISDVEAKKIAEIECAPSYPTYFNMPSAESIWVRDLQGHLECLLEELEKRPQDLFLNT